jgi:hypothetical protein
MQPLSHGKQPPKFLARLQSLGKDPNETLDEFQPTVYSIVDLTTNFEDCVYDSDATYNDHKFNSVPDFNSGFDSNTDCGKDCEAELEVVMESPARTGCNNGTPQHPGSNKHARPHISLVPSPLLRLPGELRNMIYKSVCHGALHFGVARHELEHYNGINLSKTNRQINGEIGLLAYTLLVLHIHDWMVFIDWLRHLTLPQLGAIETLHIHITIFLDKITNDVDLMPGEPSYTVHSNAYDTWPTLPNLNIAHVHIHPYRSKDDTHTSDPRLARDRALWERKADQIAKVFANQIRLLSANNVQLVGCWSDPVVTHELDMMKVCWDYGTLYKGQDGYWRCMVPGCRAPWKPQYRVMDRRW